MTNEQQPQQLTLLPRGEVPLRFRLDDATVRRGRRHIAEIRSMLRAQPPDEQGDGLPPLPRRRPAA